MATWLCGYVAKWLSRYVAKWFPPQHTDCHPCTGNHRKIIGNKIGKMSADFMAKIGLKAPGNYSGPFLTYKFSICLWENPKLVLSIISGFWDVSPSPKTNYFIFGDTRIPNKVNKSSHFNNIMFANFRTLELRNFEICRKDGQRVIPTTCLINIGKAWL